MTGTSGTGGNVSPHSGQDVEKERGRKRPGGKDLQGPASSDLLSLARPQVLKFPQSPKIVLLAGNQRFSTSQGGGL